VTARRDLGGGVLRELSHEIDVAWLLAGPLRTVSHATLSRTGAPTDGLVDTVADFTMTSHDIGVIIHLDMTTDAPYRRWEAEFDDHSLCADLLAGRVVRTYTDGREHVLHESTPGERDRAGIALLRVALGIDRVHIPAPCDVHHGLRILNTIDAVELSASSGKPVAIRE
jgi:predicted dehydrogenase